jgi:hypothetical protein
MVLLAIPEHSIIDELVESFQEQLQMDITKGKKMAHSYLSRKNG